MAQLEASIRPMHGSGADVSPESKQTTAVSYNSGLRRPAQVVNETLDDVTADDLEGCFRANVFAMIYLAQAAARHMKPRAG